MKISNDIIADTVSIDKQLPKALQLKQYANLATTKPANPQRGSIAYDLTTDTLVYFNGTDWISIPIGSNPVVI